MTELERAAQPRLPWPAAKFGLALSGTLAAALGALAAGVPGRSDLLAAAAAGAAFGAVTGVAGYVVVGRAAARSMQSAVHAFLAVMAAKVIAFAAFLLTVALTTSLHPAALAAGLVGAALAGEALLIVSLRGREGPEKGDGLR